MLVADNGDNLHLTRWLPRSRVEITLATSRKSLAFLRGAEVVKMQEDARILERTFLVNL